MKKKTWAHLARLAVLLGALLGGWMWYLHPENGSKWAVMVFLLPVAVGIWELVKRARSPSDEAQLRINRALTGAGLLLAAALALKLADAYDLLAGGMSDRAMGVILGIVVVIFGNSMPKTLEPLAKKGCEPSKTQALQRFAGWTFVLSGLAYSLV